MSTLHLKRLLENALRNQARAMEYIATTEIDALGNAVQCIVQSSHVVTLGVGKSAFVAQKMAASLISIGLDARFLHATDALHGDIGIIRPSTTMVIFSKSGETKELASLLAVEQMQQADRIVVTSNRQSSFVRSADVLVCLPDLPEYDTDNLLPTSSTTSSMAIADSIIAGVASQNATTADILRRTHPQGAIGRMLTTTVREVIDQHSTIPSIAIGARLTEAISVLNSEARGIVCGVNEAGRLQGIMTDGDIRRLVQQNADIQNLHFADVATRNPTVVHPEASLHQALRLMEERERKLSVLPVVSHDMQLLGVIQLHDVVSM
jgi:arabinose-5-phosphate isomerase